MKINIKTHGCPADDHALQIWDFYYAYRQYKSRKNAYVSDVQLAIGPDVDLSQDDINVGWFYDPQSLDRADDFDYILLDVGQHHLENCNQTMFEELNVRDNCYLVSSAYLSNDHPYLDKIIWTPMTFNFPSLITRPFYPQYFEKDAGKDDHRNEMIWINGQNRTHRQYFQSLLVELVPDLATHVLFGQQHTPDKLKDSFFETSWDRDFREFVNQQEYTERSIEENIYYPASIGIGPDEKFGLVVPGYFILDHYFQYHCVIFPETTWLNDEIWPTEKIHKCIVCQAIPWPIAGANTHALYNQLGYQTAWNLLPKELQFFDQISDHALRYKLQAQAVAWANTNPGIWQSDHAQSIREQNLRTLYNNCHDGLGAIKLHQILSASSKWRH